MAKVADGCGRCASACCRPECRLPYFAFDPDSIGGAASCLARVGGGGVGATHKLVSKLNQVPVAATRRPGALGRNYLVLLEPSQLMGILFLGQDI